MLNKKFISVLIATSALFITGVGFGLARQPNLVMVYVMNKTSQSLTTADYHGSFNLKFDPPSKVFTYTNMGDYRAYIYGVGQVGTGVEGVDTGAVKMTTLDGKEVVCEFAFTMRPGSKVYKVNGSSSSPNYTCTLDSSHSYENPNRMTISIIISSNESSSKESK